MGTGLQAVPKGALAIFIMRFRISALTFLVASLEPDTTFTAPVVY